MSDNVIKLVTPRKAAPQKEGTSASKANRLIKTQMVLNLFLAIFLMAMESHRIWLEAKVESLEEDVAALTHQLKLKKG